MPNYPELFFLSGPYFPDRTGLWQESKRPPINPHRFSKLGANDFLVSWESPTHQAIIALTYIHWATDPVLIIARRIQRPIRFFDLSQELLQMVPDLVSEYGYLFGNDALQVMFGKPSQPGSVINALLSGAIHGQEATLPDSGTILPLRLTFLPVK